MTNTGLITSMTDSYLTALYQKIAITELSFMEFRAYCVNLETDLSDIMWSVVHKIQQFVKEN